MLNDLEAVVTDAVEAGEAIERADDASDGVGPLGLLGSSFRGGEQRLDDAVDAFNDGRYDAAASAADDARAIADSAILWSLISIATAIVVGVLLALLWRAVGRLRTRRPACIEADA